jgi:hypothetical protein
MFEPRQVLHRNQLLATGIDGKELTELVRSGVVTRLWRGFYTTGEAIALPDPRGVTRSMKVVLSHESAAAWCGADLPIALDRLHVTAPRNRGRCADISSRVRLHRRDLQPGEVIQVRGIRVTSPVRTVADLSRTCRLPHAVAVADSYLRRGMTTQEALLAYAKCLPSGIGRPLVSRVAELVDFASGSVFESITRVLFAESGLPAPCTQLNIADRNEKWIGRVDFAWPDVRVIVECDGFEYHSSASAFERDRRRWAELTRAGWRVVPVTWSQIVDDPTWVVGLVADLLGVPSSK